MAYRIYLSPPHMGADERNLLLNAFDSNWIAPVGPHLDAFETEVAARVGREHAVALSSGTAALHLALLTLGVGPGDDVMVPTLTFAATANAIAYVGARPVFVDVDPDTWQIDPVLVSEELADRGYSGRSMPAAIVPVDLYGQCADYDRLLALGKEYDIPIVSDAAESLGATYRGQPAGSLGAAAILSFNGNKIITTSGGGMYLTDDESMAARVRHLSTQAREPVAHYEHRDIGFNYRMSNLLAALGRGQLGNLDERVAARRAINARYRKGFADLPGVTMMPDADYGQPTNWLTCITLSDQSGASPADLIAALGQQSIEARPIWKPMHLQPVFAGAPTIGGGAAERLFNRGVCLPSGSAMTQQEQQEIVALTANLVLDDCPPPPRA